jgi:peroxiredoxin Q/BCP
MCTFRDNFQALQTLKADILAVSGDYVFTQQVWAQQHNLPFTLLGDYGGKVSRLYSSWNSDRDMCKRTVYLIDEKGMIRYRDLKYDVSTEASFEALKAALAKLNEEKAK